MTPDDATAIGLRAGSKTFVAPLPSRSAGAGASLTRQPQQEDT